MTALAKGGFHRPIGDEPRVRTERGGAGDGSRLGVKVDEGIRAGHTGRVHAGIANELIWAGFAPSDWNSN